MHWLTGYLATLMRIHNFSCMQIGETKFTYGIWQYRVHHMHDANQVESNLIDDRLIRALLLMLIQLTIVGAGPIDTFAYSFREGQQVPGHTAD